VRRREDRMSQVNQAGEKERADTFLNCGRIVKHSPESAGEEERRQDEPGEPGG
jgi:hypothetical protein